MVKNLPAMQEMRVQSLSWEDPLAKGTAIHSSNLSWRIPRTEKPGGIQSLGSQRVGQDRAINTHTHTHTHTSFSILLFFFFLLSNCAREDAVIASMSFLCLNPLFYPPICVKKAPYLSGFALFHF